MNVRTISSDDPAAADRLLRCERADVRNVQAPG